MKRYLAIVSSVFAVALMGILASAQQAPSPTKAPLYNTAKAKLLEGKRVFSFTQSTFDIPGYCERAKHYDFTWFETQHATLLFKEIEAMIAACPYAGATPIVRVPDAQEWQIQHATDIGALGIIVPTVDDVDRSRDAAKWSHFPPQGRRSSGAGQAGRIWGINGINYRQTINDNMLVILMLETPTAAANAFDIASVPGVDVIITGNGDISNFSGFEQGSPGYEAIVKQIHDATIKAGKIWGQAAAARADGPYSYDARLFQNGPSNDGWKPPAPAGAPAGRGGAAPGGRGPAPR